jgi:hypothetical protein
VEATNLKENPEETKQMHWKSLMKKMQQGLSENWRTDMWTGI